MIALAFLLMFSVNVFAGEFYADWTLPEQRENGESFVPGELKATRVIYSRQGGNTEEYQMDLSVPASSVRVSGLKKGWWNVRLQSVSHCHLDLTQYPASYDFLSATECTSDDTPTIRVKVQ